MVEKINDVKEEEIELQIKIWKEFVERQADRGFSLNSDYSVVEILAKGVLKNEKNRGLKFCPCRMMINNLEQDKKLVCPCNFKAQKTWKQKGECWCGLFVKNR